MSNWGPTLGKPIPTSAISAEVRKDFEDKLIENCKRVDRCFAWLLFFEWMAAIVVSLVYSPYAWEGSQSQVHLHVWLAVVCGGLIVSAPLYLVRAMPGTRLCRWSMASAQILFSSLFIHLASGRIETHFHVFASMALLVAYRDITVFIPAVMIVIADHLLRGFFWPRSVFGDSNFYLLRPFEHAAWLLMETFGLCLVVRDNLQQWLKNSILQAELQAERNLLESRVASRTKQLKTAQRFRETILNSIDASICILDANGNIVFVNDNWVDLVRMTMGESANCGIGASYLEDCGISQLGSQEFAEEAHRNITLVSLGEIDSYFTEHSFTHGSSERHFRLSASPVVLENEIGVAIVYVDISHLKQAERRASELARLILESPDEVLIASFETGEFLEVNEGASKKTGYERKELLKLGLDDLFPSVHASCFQSRIRDYPSSGQGSRSFESTVRRKNGDTYPCRVSLHQATFEDQQVWLLFVADLTEQRRLEAKLNQAQKLESLGTLAAGIAHEINTPMQCVVGNFEFLRNSFQRLLQVTDYAISLLEADQIDWSQEREKLQELRKQSKYDFHRKQTPLAIDESADSSRRIVSIVRAMKAMSHPGCKEAVETDLHETINNCVMICRNRWKSVAKLELLLSPEVPKIKAYPAELSQVFVNLIVNAADAIAERHDSVQLQPGLITIETKFHQNAVVIRVSDNGCGIPDSIRSRIFDPFFTTKSIGKGTGQGLAITHSVIVEKHHGKINVETQFGMGTTFWLELPIDADSSSASVTNHFAPVLKVYSQNPPTVSNT